MVENQQQILSALRDEFGRWEQLLGGLSEGQIVARHLSAGLSIKDIIAHLWAWQQLSIARLEAALENRDLTFRLEPRGLDPDVEENLEPINAWIHEAYLTKPWPDVHRDWREGFLGFLELAKAIPEKDLLDPERYPWLKGIPLMAVLEGSFDHHHEEHLGPLLASLREKGKIA